MAHWLIVEDEPDIYATLVAMSELIGDGGVAFTDGEEAVDWIDEVDAGQAGNLLDQPRLALVDIRLPGKCSGVDVAARLRRSAILTSVGIVLITAYRLNAQEEREVMEASGADLLLYKPLPKIQEFQPILEGLLQDNLSKKT